MGSQMEPPRDKVHLGEKERVYGCLVSYLFSLMLFFWVVNASVTKLVAWRSLVVDVVAKTVLLQLKSVSSRRKRLLVDLDPVY